MDFMKGATTDALGYVPRHLRVCYDYQGWEPDRRIHGRSEKQPRKLVQKVGDEVIAEYISVVQASEVTGIGKDSIHKNLQKRTKSGGTFVWEWRYC